MPERLTAKFAGVAFLVLGCSCFSTPAMAGFQYVSPPEAPAPAPQPMQMPDTSAAPMAPVTQAPPHSTDTYAGTSPTPTSNTSEEVPVYTGPMPGMMPSRPPSMETPASNAPTPLVPATTDNMAPQPMPSGPPAIVHGFAKNVPLAVALRQVLPPGYAFSIDQNVDMGVLLSFQGGRPWRDTLRDSLAAAGLVMREQGQMVSIGYAVENKTVTLTPKRSLMSDAPLSASNVSYQPGTAPQALGGAYDPAPVIITAPMRTTKSITAVDSWSANRGDNLHDVLEKWSRRAQIEFDWMAEYDYPLQASVNFTGTFEEAVRNILVGFQGAHPQPIAELHSNPILGQMVLIVQTRGNTDSD